jgi:hypothetical protein
MQGKGEESYQRIDRRNVDAVCGISAHRVSVAGFELGLEHSHVANVDDDEHYEFQFTPLHGGKLVMIGHQRIIACHAYRPA